MVRGPLSNSSTDLVIEADTLQRQVPVYSTARGYRESPLAISGTLPDDYFEAAFPRLANDQHAQFVAFLLASAGFVALLSTVFVFRLWGSKAATLFPLALSAFLFWLSAGVHANRTSISLWNGMLHVQDGSAWLGGPNTQLRFGRVRRLVAAERDKKWTLLADLADGNTTVLIPQAPEMVVKRLVQRLNCYRKIVPRGSDTEKTRVLD